ncbi:MAG: glycosyltransferase family 39 protein, partial [Chloroflexi bacterium]|nr:glycosyltransferase family 39 protein [Chloroflexota bacterium]
MALIAKIKNLLDRRAVYIFLIAVVILTFLYLSFNLAHTMPSRLDEGAFLIKGYYYWTGKFVPFEDYGPWTNNMPLAYYIPGLAQYIFGPGLLTGRYFAIFLTLLTFLALFLLIKRLTNKWWALLTITPFAVNPALLMVYVQTISEGVAACLLSWALFFLIGEDRKTWQIAAGAFLSALTILTRQNMIFLAPFVIVYSFWLHGKKAGFITLSFLSLPLIAVHLIFFPDIFNLWFAWLPGFIKNYINIGKVSIGGTQFWRPEVESFDRISSLALTFRYQLVSFLFLFISLILLPIKKAWNFFYERKLVLLLTLTYLVFFGMHAWASLGKNYCVFCLSNYIAFFIPLVVVAGTISVRNLI